MDDFDSTVIEVLKEFGTKVVYIKGSPGEYNPASGEVTTTFKEIPVLAATLDISGTTKNGTEVKMGDKQILLQPPKVGLSINITDDLIKVGNITYKIVAYKEINPTGSRSILFDIYARR